MSRRPRIAALALVLAGLAVGWPAGQRGAPTAIAGGAIQMIPLPLRDVWYVGEPITVRLAFVNLDTEATLLNVSPRTLAGLVFELVYDDTTQRFVASQRADSTVKYCMLGPSEETTVECILFSGPIPFGASFDRKFYGVLPRAPTTATIRAIYTNLDTGVQNVVPFWTGTVASEAVIITVARR